MIVNKINIYLIGLLTLIIFISCNEAGYYKASDNKTIITKSADRITVYHAGYFDRLDFICTEDCKLEQKDLDPMTPSEKWKLISKNPLSIYYGGDEMELSFHEFHRWDKLKVTINDTVVQFKRDGDIRMDCFVEMLLNGWGKHFYAKPSHKMKYILEVSNKGDVIALDSDFNYLPKYVNSVLFNY